MSKLDDNLADYLNSMDDHCVAHGECATRRKAATEEANRISRLLPLAHARGTAIFEKNCESKKLISQRSFYGMSPPPKADGTQRDEVILKTDNDVFTYAGAFRYPQIAPCGVMFSAEVEKNFPRPMAATPFDSGALLRHLTAKRHSLNLPAFLRECEIPVPQYRTYFAAFAGCLFDAPGSYFKQVTEPVCEEPIRVTGGDKRRWTFEVRFDTMLEFGGFVVALFLPDVVAQEEWAIQAAHECIDAGAEFIPYSTETGQDWEALLNESVSFIQRYLRI